jgi:hypothetical protein
MMDSLSIRICIGLDRKARPVRGTPIQVAAEINSAIASAETLTGRMLYLLPYQVRQIQDSNDIVARCKGREYRLVRLDEDGTFELRKDVGAANWRYGK